MFPLELIQSVRLITDSQDLNATLKSKGWDMKPLLTLPPFSPS